MKINHQKRTKLFYKICFIPIIIFTVLMLYAGFKTGFQEFKIVLIGVLSIDGIWFIISYIISLVISLFLFKEIKEEHTKTIQKKSNHSSTLNNNCSCKKFEYSLKDYNLYTIMGEANYVYAKRNKFFEGKKIKIKNSYNILITLLPFLIIHVILVKLYILIILYLVIFEFILISYKKSIKNLTQEGQITISSNGISLESTVSIFAPYENIELCFLTNDFLLIHIKEKSICMIIEPKEEIYNEIKKYMNDVNCRDLRNL